ncbi:MULTISPECIES: sugar nucleotide-binding protein [Salinicola]|uniref:dTDP-4-dehydrorhamnose reductase n=1 Tax=Salinicola socius TaxID=404433 RepID=A0A1Q8SNA2_9GAMM|nr:MULTISPECIES: sugar nucleotide-binding protein [Salinicola]OLO02907.1 dTDP-4-dehydrorhamnose reductase [Salinicola socius]
MKCLVLQAEHCLNLALRGTAVQRGDIAYLPAPAVVDVGVLTEIAPDAVIVPPLADPGHCEPAAVYRHADRVEALLEACQTLGIPLVWGVSDTLYEDGAESPIDETVLPQPRDAAMRRLVEVGQRVRHHPRHLILRLGPLFGLEGEDAWLSELIESLVRGESVRATQDLVLCPTSVMAAARAITGMLLQLDSGAGAWGTYHLCGTEPVSVFTFCSVVRTQLATRLEGVGASPALGELQALNQHHDTPLRRVLDCRRLLDVFGIHQKSWRLELGLMLDAWCQQHYPDHDEADNGSRDSSRGEAARA